MTRCSLSALVLCGLGLVVPAGTATPVGQEGAALPHESVTVPGEVALAGLVALGDGHLQRMAHSLELAAGTEAVQTGAWERVRPALAAVAERNVAALHWFALPDGSYWTLQHGKAEGNLSGRAYFPRVLEGETVIGELAISTATGRPVAIVATPVIGANGTAAGMLGASVYLDELSALIERQLALDDTMIFYSFDETGLFALDWAPELIFLDPEKLGEEDFTRAYQEMRRNERGTVSYTLGGRERTVIYQRSPITGWWYVFGLVPEGRAN